MDANQQLEIASKLWASVNDIMILGNVGKNKAYQVRDEIIEKLKQEDRYLSNKHVPMEEVIKYFKININYLKKVSRK